jgi:hypothetical protein
MGLESFLSSVKQIVKKATKDFIYYSIKNPLKVGLTAATLTFAPLINGCGDGSTGPVIDINRLEVLQVGGGWGWEAPNPDWIYCKNAGNQIPDDSKVNSAGFNVIVKFVDPNNRFIKINDVPIKLTNDSGGESILGSWHPGEVGWNPEIENCINDDSYKGTGFKDNYGQSVALVTNGVCSSWPIGGLFHMGTGSPGIVIGELGSTFAVVNESGEFKIICPSSSKLVGAKATYNFRKTTSDYWFWSDWGPDCKQNFQQAAAATGLDMSMSNFRQINQNTSANLESLASARSETGIIKINEKLTSKKDSELVKLVRSKQVMKKSPGNDKKRTINQSDYEPIGALDYIAEALNLNSENQESLLAEHTRDVNEVWEAGAFYWTFSMYKPPELQGVNLTQDKFAKYGQTCFVKLIGSSDEIKSIHKVKFFPVEEGVDDGREWFYGWSNDIVPSWTGGAGGFYLPDSNTPFYYARTVIPVQAGDRISNLYIAQDIPFTREDLSYMSKNWLKDINTAEYWDGYNDFSKDGVVNLKDFSARASYWAPEN